MAEKTKKLNAKAFAFVRYNNQTSHYTPSGTTWYALRDQTTARNYRDNYFYIQFDAWPSSLKHRRLLGISDLRLAFKCANDGEDISNNTPWVHSVYGDYDFSRITYENQYSDNYDLNLSGTYQINANETKNISVTDKGTAEYFAYGFLRFGSILKINSRYSSVSFPTLYTRATLVDGTTAPSITIKYDDSLYYGCSTARVSPSTDGVTLNPGVAQTFSWRLVKEQYDPADWIQKSATFYWRATSGSSAATAWHSIAISGNTTQVTIPAKTFPNGKTIQYYVVVVDELNNSHSEGTASSPHNFVAETVKPIPSYPLDRASVNPAESLLFSWLLQSASGTNYDAEWTEIRWTSGTSTDVSTWNVIQAGSGSSFSVPAYTFPASSTIKWTLRSEATQEYTDGTGQYSATTRTFTTLGYELKLVRYPSGQNVCSGNQIPVTYTLQTTTKVDVRQTGSKLYWRTDTTSPYSEITNSTETKALAFPANTIPTNATVQWYITVTAADGSTYSTNPATFNTAESQIVPQSSPTAGYTDPRQPILFSWYFQAGSGSVTGTASLFWKRSTDQTYTEVPATGNSITIPANTFPVASTIQWYLAGEDYSGQESETDVFEFSTAAAPIRVITRYPVNGTVDGTQPITFQWTFDSADGFPVSRVVFEWKLPSEDSQHWHTVFDEDENITEYTMPADSFSPGQIDWRVRAWNIDEVLGIVGTASFICMIAPTMTVVSATAVPFSTITWQVNDQQSYEIMVDGNRLGPYFGTEKRFGLPDYLRDGVHTIKVRVMGSLGLWSQWAETSVDIQNASEDTLSLEGSGPTEAALQWTTESETADFLIYRDGIMIGHTENLLFTDRFANGEHTYFVINRLSSGNYDISNAVVLELSVQRMTMAAADGGEWITIPYELKSQKDPTYTKTKSVSFNHIAGHLYPVGTMSEFYEEPMEASAVFLYKDKELEKKFSALFGIPIIVKAADGACFVGVISSWTRQPNQGYYTAYTFTVNRIDWEEFIDDAQ